MEEWGTGPDGKNWFNWKCAADHCISIIGQKKTTFTIARHKFEADHEHKSKAKELSTWIDKNKEGIQRIFELLNKYYDNKQNFVI